MVDLTKAKGGFLGNIYGKHDGYDGSVYTPKSLGKAVVASTGGVACVLIVKRLQKT